jgi:hypothetical protein
MKPVRSVLPFTAVVLVLCILLLQSCRPRITAIYPLSGPPGTLVHVTGVDLFGGLIKWDAGSATERGIPGGFLTASFFTIPMDATPGPHQVRVQGLERLSDPVTFTVTVGVIRPPARIDDITVRNFTINRQGLASFYLLLHCANVDAGAQVEIDGVLHQGYLWRALGNERNMQVTQPITLGYPIFHYGTLLCPITNVRPGTMLRRIRIRNLDGMMSYHFDSFTVARNMKTLDSDGDGLTDEWETSGYDANGDGTIDVNLPALGAHPLRKDIFVEVDWMPGRDPQPEVWDYSERLFANAPILNSDGSSGITLHIDRGQRGAGGGGGSMIPYHYGLLLRPMQCYPFNRPGERTCGDFVALKQANFDSSRLRIYRYCIFGVDNANGSVAGGAEGSPANDFMVTIGTVTTDRSAIAVAQTHNFLHELGHTLGWYHGGSDGLAYKPNYNSTMSYLYNNEGVDTDCTPGTDSRVFDFSQGMRRVLDETCLDEPDGICDRRPVDWNRDGRTDGRCIQANIDQDTPDRILRDFPDWATLKYDFTVDTFWRHN